MPLEDQMTVGQRIRELRLKRGWSQAECAVHCGVALTVVTGTEQAKRSNDIRLSSLFSIAGGFGMTISAFLEGVTENADPETKESAAKKK